MFIFSCSKPFVISFSPHYWLLTWPLWCLNMELGEMPASWGKVGGTTSLVAVRNNLRWKNQARPARRQFSPESGHGIHASEWPSRWREMKFNLEIFSKDIIEGSCWSYQETRFCSLRPKFLNGKWMGCPGNQWVPYLTGTEGSVHDNGGTKH